MAFRFPICAPIIETIIDSTHPPHIGIHIMLFQKLGSRIDDKISPALQIKGTYQILFGFSMTIKKQPAAIIKSLIIWLINPDSVCGVNIESVMKKTISATIKTNNANTALGIPTKYGCLPFGFIVSCCDSLLSLLIFLSRSTDEIDNDFLFLSLLILNLIIIKKRSAIIAKDINAFILVSILHF
jgi:hypothetical protein